MYKELSFRSVSKLGRIIVPGFIFGAETERVMGRCASNRARARWQLGNGHCPTRFLELNLRLKKSL